MYSHVNLSSRGWMSTSSEYMILTQHPKLAVLTCNLNKRETKPIFKISKATSPSTKTSVWLLIQYRQKKKKRNQNLGPRLFPMWDPCRKKPPHTSLMRLFPTKCDVWLPRKYMKTQKLLSASFPLFGTHGQENLQRRDWCNYHPQNALFVRWRSTGKRKKSKIWVPHLHYPGPTDKKTSTDEPNSSFLNSTPFKF